MTTCDDDQSGGVQNGHDDVSTNAANVVVKNLNQDIGPTLNSGRTAGLMFTYDSGDSLTSLVLQYLEGTHRIVTNTSAYDGILFSSVPKDGDKGKHHDSSSGGNGDAGQDGRSLNLTLGSGASIVSESNNGEGRGIAAITPGGNGGEGGGSDCCSGGHGGPGGGAGQVSIAGGGSILMEQSESTGVFVQANGGSGGSGNESGADGHGGNGEAGGPGGFTQLDSVDGWTITTKGATGSPGVNVTNLGGNGGHGAAGSTSGGDGGAGGWGNDIQIGLRYQGSWTAATSGSQSPGLTLNAIGGTGSHGGQGDTDSGGHGGQGGQGGSIVVGDTTSSITTAGSQSAALVMYSKAGQGGEGGAAKTAGKGGKGGSGGGGGELFLNGTWNINTTGSESHGIAMYSLGADGGKGGDGTFSSSGAGGNTGASGRIDVDIDGSVSTAGGGALGIIAQSVAGHAGAGGTSVGVVAFAASGGSAGAGGDIGFNNAADVTTTGDESTAVTVQSIGGGGGRGGDAFSEYFSVGGGGSLGGDGGALTLLNLGSLTTSGNDAHALFVQSIGGAGGAGGNAGGIVALGGGGKAAANGGAIELTNMGVIATGIDSGHTPVSGTDPVCGTGCSNGILAQSIGGGGGHGGTAGGAFSVGGKGGAGGKGGKITMTNAADVSTTMVQSPAILAQSIGGGGGNGGGSGSLGAGLSVAVGGGGGNGGDGGAVAVTLQDGAGASTAGDDSPGVHAQSIGGGGGNAGFAVAAAVGVDIPAVAIAVGGSGGDGGSSGAVSIDSIITPDAMSNNSDLIATTGDRSHGLFAQSTGGGGGNGGVTAALAASNEADIALAIGGSGGSGGDAGTAGITSVTSVATAGANASGVIAQSIGGGGGNGGITVSGTVNIGSDGATIALGGGGGNAGDGNSVTVSQDGAVTAAGYESYGVVAQSIGGGGGNGGMTIAGTLSSSSSSQTFGVAIGSAAGSGGSGADVALTTTDRSTVTTQGNRGIGVYAQSIGGGGGNGGITLNGNIAGSSDVNQADVTLGSDGGSGGNASTVTVTNAAAVMTGTMDQFGYSQAHGVVAQSIGGGGGNGAITGFLGMDFSEESRPSLEIVMSGSGKGGKGKAVTIDNSGAVSTLNRNSHALFAQSVGGGGGDADAAMWSLLDLAVNDPTPSFSTDYISGGSLAAGNTGGAASITNSGALTTAGPWSHAIFAQSVGGGGGSSAPLGNPFLPCSSCKTESIIWNATVALGGQTGSGGDGGDVTVANSGNITTAGPGSYGMFAQSIGAGGGSSGAASALSQAGQYAGASEFTAMDAALGAFGNGSDPVSGNGGAVSVTHSAGTIESAGIGATAIYAQSVGAGGGHGGVGAIGGGGSIDVGGNGDAAGDGGDVTVKVTGGSIKAGTGSGAAGIVSAAYGIFAQSVGGGGGHAGNVLMGSTDNFASLIGLTSGKGNDSSGKGGDVSVTLDIALETSGDSSVGILAQSVGGGGGIQGETVKGPTGARAGSNGGSGTAGKVSVAVSGSVTTNGPNAHGIWAQSAGGSSGGTSTDTKVQVDINDTGSVLTNGPGAIGIYAQSSGDGRGAVAVNINDTSAFVVGEIGIYIKDAPTSTITNAGGIGTAQGDTGVAIQGDNTTLTITNTGGIDGQICKTKNCDSSPGLASSTLIVNNEPGGVVITRARMHADEFNNAGTLVIGGDGRISTTEHTGNFVHESTGVIVMDLDAANHIADRIHTSGTGLLSGSIRPVVQNAGSAQDAAPILLMQFDGGIGDTVPAALSVEPSAVGDYGLDFSVPNEVYLNYRFDFANDAIVAGTNANQRAMTEYLQRLYEAGEMDHTLTALIAIPDVPSYAQAMDAFSPQVVADTQTTSLQSSQLFSDALLSCAVREGDYRFISEGQCGWLRMQARSYERDTTSTNIGIDQSTWDLAGGAQFAIGNDWFVGAGLSYEDRTLREKDHSGRSSGDLFQAGLILKKQLDALLLSGALTAGKGRFDNRREAAPNTWAEGTQDMRLIAAQLRGAWNFDFGTWYVEPHADLGVNYLDTDAYSETGAGSMNLQYDGSSETFVYGALAMELGAEFRGTGDALYRPKLILGVTQYLSDTDPSTIASFATTSPQAGTFTATSELDRTYLDVGIGVDVLSAGNVVLRLNGFGQFSSDVSSYGGNLKLSVPF